jgi:hypothetical protein
MFAKAFNKEIKTELVKIRNAYVLILGHVIVPFFCLVILGPFDAVLMIGAARSMHLI